MSFLEEDMDTTQTNGTAPMVQDLSLTKLLALLKHPANATAAEVAAQIQALHRLVESLPLTSAEFCFAHNWLTSAQQLWEAGDCATAGYQVSLVAKKLNLTARRDGPCHSHRQPAPCT